MGEVTWSLYDKDEPATGASVTFGKGGYCAASGENRKFTFNFVCPDSNREFYNPADELKFETTVSESDEHACDYSITVETTLACPYECLTKESDEGFTVCGGKGLCAADPNVGFVRCLCDDGWTGNGCSEV